MAWEHKVPEELAKRIVNILHEVTGNNVQFMGNNGEIIATTQPERRGDIHEGAQKVMAGEWDKASISTAEAEEMEGCLPGYTGAVDHKGERIACIGITGDPEEVRPLQQMAAKVVEAEIQQQREQEKKAEVIDEVFSRVEQVSATAEELTASSQEISTQAQETESLVEDVNDSMSRTEEIYNTIRKIADQTTILGLNASIEAARLGQEGAGFAVVAEEIRKLSEDSKESISDIDEIFTEMRRQMDLIDGSADDTSEITEQQAQAIQSLTDSIIEIQEILEDLIKD